MENKITPQKRLILHGIIKKNLAVILIQGMLKPKLTGPYSYPPMAVLSFRSSARNRWYTAE